MRSPLTLAALCRNREEFNDINFWKLQGLSILNLIGEPASKAKSSGRPGCPSGPASAAACNDEESQPDEEEALEAFLREELGEDLV